jgi:hypothetical protein
MFARAFAVLIAFSSLALLAGCANTKPAVQTDSTSIIREPESHHEVHGEVGVMYGSSSLSQH